MRRPGTATVVAVGGIATLVVALASLAVGAVHVPFGSVLDVLAGASPGPDDVEAYRARTVVMEMRLPRVVGGSCVGAALGGAGAMLQSMLRNPLASPQALGASNAAGFGAVLAIWLGLGYAAGLVVGFAAAAAAVLMVLAMARARHGVTTDSVVLAGLNMSLLAGALTGLVQYAAKSDAQLRDMVIWLLGGLWRVTWEPLAIVAPLVVLTLIAAFPLMRPLDLLAVGEADAVRLGVPVKPVRVITLATACLLTSLAVCLAGVVAFVGLVVPHAARRIVGTSNRVVFPASVFLGAMLVVAADAAARTAFVPSELPLGVVTSLIGVPCFFVLMKARPRTGLAR